MIEHRWHRDHTLLEVCPRGPVREEDFQSLAAQVDPVISKQGGLRGLLINAQDSAGWESFAALISHCRLIRDHQKHIHKIAVVSDHPLLAFMPCLVDHFVRAEVRPFPAEEKRSALAWLAEPG